MILLEDTRNKPGSHKIKNAYWKSIGVEVRRTKLYVGDYTLPTDQSICIDSKASIMEIEQNICGHSHERFRNELIRAQEAGIKLIILVENEPGYADRNQTVWNKQITCIKDVFQWKNPRLFIFQGKKQKYPRATRGQTLAKAMLTCENRYSCKFLFCNPRDAGRKVIELLGGGADE